MTNQTQSSGEQLAVIGSGRTANRLAKHGGAAGWGVARVDIFPGDSADGAECLSDGRSGAIHDATIIAIATPASAHHALAILLAEQVRDDQLVLLVPGQPGGAFQFAHAFGAEGPTVAETSLAPDDAVDVPLATVPAANAQAVAQRIAPLLRATAVANAFWTALHAPDVLVRGVAPLLADHGTVSEALNGTGAAVVQAVETERQAIAAALGLTVPAWTHEGIGADADAPLPDRSDPDWLATLAPFGLVPLCAIGAHAGVATPRLTALVAQADELLGSDYHRAGRTAELMGLTTNGEI